MSDTNHTPLPWSRSDYREDIVDGDGELLATTYSMDDGGDDAAAANAAFIVRAANFHDPLVAALRRLIAANEACTVIFAASSDEAAIEAEYGEAMDAARAALAAAEAA